ncbi:unnamed protein product [Clonostachys rosea f. rosea IK726]|uniref:Uncharacterized protein n=1 Tax=Clonostachys rosea f. rosea IK726 TaxID=1349383 RepID=A0ACA9TFY3_BIOOC|nr:unnamed protein product [Clonostachys rosea f. rosea IK726]
MPQHKMRRCGTTDGMIGQMVIGKGGWMAAWPTSRTFQVANADECTFFPKRRALYLVKTPPGAICPLSYTSASSSIASHQIEH